MPKDSAEALLLTTAAGDLGGPHRGNGDENDRTLRPPCLTSLGMAAFNNDSTNHRALGALQAQTANDLEILILNLGSTGGTPEICGRLALSGP